MLPPMWHLIAALLGYGTIALILNAIEWLLGKMPKTAEKPLPELPPAPYPVGEAVITGIVYFWAAFGIILIVCLAAGAVIK